jgi:hypothetical protein|tara:strand:- start:239 stop:478 length:240 start_codon:yes stop_codon:yes gene_type:complete
MPNEQEKRSESFDIWTVINSPKFQIIMAVVKIVAVISFIYLITIVTTEIEAIKLLNYDACAYCMAKTGATCLNPMVGFP